MDDNRHIVTLTVSELEEFLISRIIEEIKKASAIADLKPIKNDLINSLLPRKDVAKMFKISTVSLDKWKKAGLLPPPIKMAGRVYYLKSDIIELIKNRKQTNHGK